jgi:hypothetical protein
LRKLAQRALNSAMRRRRRISAHSSGAKKLPGVGQSTVRTFT